jgi:hypothetical protein
MKVYTLTLVATVAVLLCAALRTGKAVSNRRHKHTRLWSELSYVRGYEDGQIQMFNIQNGVLKTAEEAIASFDASKSNWLNQVGAK